MARYTQVEFSANALACKLMIKILLGAIAHISVFLASGK